MFASVDIGMIMGRFASILFGIWISCTCTAENISVEEIIPDRVYILHKPDNLPANAPLVLALHGYGSNGRTLQWYSGMNEAADMNGFAVAYPDGTRDRGGNRHWNANLNISSTDDVKYLSELARDLQAEHQLDPMRTFVFGMSNGGFMSYTLACETHNVFRGMASVTGTMSGYDWNNCNPREPIPVLHIHGIDDRVVPIDGSMQSGGGWGGAPHVDQVVSFWAELNATKTVDSVFVSPSTHAFYYRHGQNGNEVWYHRISDWGHQWPGPEDQTGTVASQVIGEFFRRF